MLFNEPKLLKFNDIDNIRRQHHRFSALQRAEIAEIEEIVAEELGMFGFSALQRAEIAEIRHPVQRRQNAVGFSALQRAEIAEMEAAKCYQRVLSVVSVLFNEPKLLKLFDAAGFGSVNQVSVLFNEPKLLKSIAAAALCTAAPVSVLFNEPKLLKYSTCSGVGSSAYGFSALQRAEIAEICGHDGYQYRKHAFQCSSTSRNC